MSGGERCEMVVESGPESGDERECGRPSVVTLDGLSLCYTCARWMHREGDVLSEGATRAFERLEREVMGRVN